MKMKMRSGSGFVDETRGDEKVHVPIYVRGTILGSGRRSKTRKNAKKKPALPPLPPRESRPPAENQTNFISRILGI